VFLQDSRDAAKATIYLAERGRTANVDGASLLVLERGSVQRQQGAGQDPAIVTFDTYAVDLSQLAEEVEQVVYKPRERSTGELLDLDETNAYVRLQAGRFRAELHDRFAAPLFPFACMAIAFAALGNARTTRQGRSGAIFGAVVAIVALRVAIFAASGLVVRNAWAVPLLYLIPITATLAAGIHAFRPDLPRRLLAGVRRRGAAPRTAGLPA
jgi:lipopolysaccharide export system permease protein